jgi:transposase-like protein
VKAKRKRHDAQFKARVALEALKGIKTVQQIAKEFDVHPVQVSDWKKKLCTQAGSVFETGRQQEQEDFSAERTDLHSKIGELTVKGTSGNLIFPRQPLSLSTIASHKEA